MIDPISIAIMLNGAGKSVGAILTQIQSARNTHRLIKSNEEIGRKAGLNQLKIAEMQIRNLQELEERKRETHVRIADKKIQSDKELAELAARRQLSIEQLKLEMKLLMQQLDHQQQTELEKFRAQEHFASLQWRTEKEREFRIETTELVNKVRENIALENRAHIEKMVGYKQLHKKSWPLRNPSLIYLQPDDNRLLLLLSPPVITFQEAGNYDFPLIETYLTRYLREFLMPFYAGRIDLDSGSWLNKDFRGDAALKPLSLELSSRSFVVFDSHLSGFPFGRDLLNLSVAYKGSGQQECSFAGIINDHRYRPATAELPADWDTLCKLWTFLHSIYAAIYTDIHFFQAGDPGTLNFIQVLRRMITDPAFGPFLAAADGGLNKEVLGFIKTAVSSVLQGISQLFYVNEHNYRITLALAAELKAHVPEAAEEIAAALAMSFEYWTLHKAMTLTDLFDEKEQELLLAKLDGEDLPYLQAYSEASHASGRDQTLTSRINELLDIVQHTRVISI